MDDSITPGQIIQCTLKRQLPQDNRRYKTVQRLMRLDPDNAKALRKAQEHRDRTLVVRSRGKRPWPVRQKAAKVAVPREGVTWKMKLFPHLRPDLASVEDLIDIKPL